MTKSRDPYLLGIGHRLVKKTKGAAKQYDCIDCGKSAHDWSHTHDSDPTKIDSYNPRCRSCHLKYDIQFRGIPSRLGAKQTEEAKAKISAARSGKPTTPVGWKHSEETKIKMGEIQKYLAPSRPRGEDGRWV